MALSVVATDVAQKFLQSCGVRFYDELSPQQKAELDRLWAKRGVNDSVFARETLSRKLRPIVEMLGGKILLRDLDAEIVFADDHEPLRLRYIDNGINLDPNQPGLADLRHKICSLEKLLGEDTEGSTVWTFFRESAYMLRGVAGSDVSLDFYGDLIILRTASSETRYEFTWKGVLQLRKDVRRILKVQ